MKSVLVLSLISLFTLFRLHHQTIIIIINQIFGGVFGYNNRHLLDDLHPERTMI